MGMEYEGVRLLKQSEKSTVQLVREKGAGGDCPKGDKLFVRKLLKGRHPVYQLLQNCPHPCLPKLYEVILTEDSTIVIEEYIEGQPPTAELPEKQFLNVVRKLCSVLEFLHGRGIIHRDIKPSNILLTENGHVRLIDFDAARMPREAREQDTVLLGTRGFAPPEPDDSGWYSEMKTRHGGSAREAAVLSWNIGDGISYADSPFAVSDAFEYTGETAPPRENPVYI